MDPNQRNAKHEAQTAQLYEAIGKCAVKFEHICFNLRQGITALLGEHGLNNQRLSQVLLADLTAYPLKSILQSLIAEIATLPPPDKAICDKIFARVQNLIEQRNDIVHRTWFVGWASSEDTDFSIVSGHKWSRGKQGANPKQVEYECTDFDAFANECDIAAELVNRLWTSILIGHPLSGNFKINDEGRVACPSQG